MKNYFSFLSFKDLTKAYLVKTSTTHDKCFMYQYLEDDDPISAKYAA